MSSIIQKFIEIDYTVDEMKQGVVEFLTKNPEITVSDLAVRIISSGVDIEYASNITGVPIDKLQNVRH